MRWLIPVGLVAVMSAVAASVVASMQPDPAISIEIVAEGSRVELRCTRGCGDTPRDLKFSCNPEDTRCGGRLTVIPNTLFRVSNVGRR